ncbi:leucine-rich repeat-containing protein 9-like [Orussus abietinus]|uniref:leucine-rich repeat-containing protein 9-like n=1 Tax=Orussus abietinus TaxID=222816 RepID=UPI000C715F82|nr:leucine-rich repeat-containing protein 9-like [Orussus abietinus]
MQKCKATPHSGVRPRVKSSSSTISEILSADIPSWPILSNANINNLLCLTGDIRNLVEINISAQQIRRIDISLDLPNLRDLDISCNRLSSLPNIEILKNVENLNISLNKLRNLQIDEILPRLKHLNISWNELNKCRECCRAFGDFMPNLSRLNFENNPFKDIIESERVIMTAGIYLKQLQYCNETALQDVRLIAEEEFLSLENIFEYFGASEFQDLPESEFISEINKGLKSPPRINFPKVKLLNLSGNSLTTCDFLHNCCSLQWFCMSNNLLEKVSLEEPLARLSKLNFSGNFISTPEGLTQANLPVLKYLDLTHNLITSLLPMGSYISLREFYCSHNKISNLENIYNLKSWDGLKVIDLSRNPINPIKLCKSFLVYHLSTLEFVCGKRVLEADVVEANTLFGGLLDKCTLVAMHSTSYLSSMRQLSIIHCSVKEVDLTSETLPNLESLDLSKNSISYLWGLHTLQNLRTLCLSYNKVERFNRATSRTTELKSGFFPKLLTLYLDHNGIRTLVEMNLEKMAALTHIYLQHNNLGDINGIQTCAAMETLVLDSNKISAITEEDFPPSNKIKYLFMENNRTKYLCFAKRLLKLEKLFVANNKISDKGQLKHLMPLSVLTEMTIVGNPLCKKMNHYKLILEILPLLRTIDGCSVLLEDYLME